MASLLYGLSLYAAVCAYVGFWFGISHTDNRYPGWKTAGLIIASAAAMPFAIPFGVVAGIRNMLTGTTVIFYVVDIYDDGTEIERQIVWMIPAKSSEHRER